VHDFSEFANLKQFEMGRDRKRGEVITGLWQIHRILLDPHHTPPAAMLLACQLCHIPYQLQVHMGRAGKIEKNEQHCTSSEMIHQFIQTQASCTRLIDCRKCLIVWQRSGQRTIYTQFIVFHQLA
jgi:hypothetical protein